MNTRLPSTFGSEAGPTLIGAIELVSPANKACPEPVKLCIPKRKKASQAAAASSVRRA